MTKSSRQLKSISSLSDTEFIKDYQQRAGRAQLDINKILGIESSQKVTFFPVTEEAETIILNIFNKFHTSACVLKNRKTNPFIIKDEPDAQDLLETLLRQHFDDVIPEESVPTTAGGTTFIDFMLTPQQIGIEVKMGAIGNRELRKQINDDKGSYLNHPNCKSLFVIVYDPDHKVGNPRRFEEQLSEEAEKMVTKVFVRPI
jgi:hypothetical protein